VITLREVHKSFGGQGLFEGASLQINSGDRYALVGPNGAGKSTLFKMLLGLETPDSGELQIKRGTVVGYLPQENPPVSDRTVVEEALSDFEEPDGRLVARAKAVLAGLGFNDAGLQKPVNTLSGGWAMRVALAKLLLKQPDLLLLDEPTNHLDIDSLFWFQKYLKYYPGAVFLISHERAFINEVCKSIVSVQDKSLKVYRGDYEFFVREREAENERIVSQWKQQQTEIAAMEDFIARNRARVSTANRAQSMIKRLEKMEKIQLPASARAVKIRFPQPRRTGVRVLQLKNVNKSYGDVQVYKDLNFELERGWRMAFVGHNGAGKSTLLKILGGIIPFDSGELVPGLDVKVGYFSQHREGQLRPGRTVFQEALDNDRMNPELMVRTVLGSFLFTGDSVHKKTDVLSGGEKSRLQLAKLLLDPPNVLLLDEPTTHLDMSSVDALIDALKDFEGTICCISHDLYFLNAIADHVVHVDGGKVTLYPGNYEYFKSRQQAWHEENPKAKEVPKPEEKPKVSAAAKPKNVEKDRMKLEARLEELAARLSDPALYENMEEVTRVGNEIEEVQARLQELDAPAS
jgi:ATP-binding cassette subfamily F protein 3